MLWNIDRTVEIFVFSLSNSSSLGRVGPFCGRLLAQTEPINNATLAYSIADRCLKFHTWEETKTKQLLRWLCAWAACSCVRFSFFHTEVCFLPQGCTRRDWIPFTHRILAFGQRTVRVVLGWIPWKNPRFASLTFCTLEMRKTSPGHRRWWLTSAPGRRYTRLALLCARLRWLRTGVSTSRLRITGTEYTWHPCPDVRLTRSPRLRRAVKTLSSASIGYYPQISSPNPKTPHHCEVRQFSNLRAFVFSLPTPPVTITSPLTYDKTFSWIRIEENRIWWPHVFNF